MTYKFKREPDSGLILVNIEIDNKYELKMILDTGATNTTIDNNALYLLGYDLKDNIGTVKIETANGVIETEVFEIDFFESLGLTKEKFQIQVYDFLAHGIFSDYNGLLGLDFFEGTKFCIDMKENTITILWYFLPGFLTHLQTFFLSQFYVNCHKIINIILGWNEIKERAVRFSKEWQNAFNEEADAKQFLIEFFNVFGIYNPLTMPPDLVKAHNELDKAVDLAYRPQPFVNETKRIEYLFELYDKYTAGLFAKEKKRQRR